MIEEKQNTKLKLVLCFLMIGLMLGCSVHAQKPLQGAKSTQALAQASTDMVMHPEYAKSIARMAYIWGYPMVNMANRRTAIGSAPEPGRMWCMA